MSIFLGQTSLLATKVYDCKTLLK